ncbi:MAG: DUF5615 family PIN-like protein [Gemmataceae bacterium]|nr:DUF5615 family PIN-like protein [Gemmataceae bacterium]
MKVLVDVSAGLRIAEALRSSGHDVVSVRDVDPRMSDRDILDWATRDGRLIVTMDKDFGELVHRSGQSHSGVLLLRLDTMGSEEKVRVVNAIFANFATELAARFSVYQDGRLRIR